MNSIRTLYCDIPNRRLLVGSADGLGILDERTGRWTYIGAEQGLKVTNIRSIRVVGQAIWIAAGDQGAFMILGKTIFPFNSASGFPTGSMNAVATAPDASLWFGYSTGLIHYYGKHWNSFGNQASTGIPFKAIDQVEIGPNKKIWIASAQEGICPFDPVELFCSMIYHTPPGVHVTDLAVDDNGTAYAATSGSGVLVLTSDGLNTLALDQKKLISNAINDLAESPDGRMWVATDQGINTFDLNRPDEPWQVFQAGRDQLALPRVTDLLATADGMWFAYDQAPQASYFDGRSWLQLDSLKGLPGAVQNAVIDQHGYIWFATNQGIRVWDGAVLRTYAPPGDLLPNHFYTLFSEANQMWLGTDRGLLRYQDHQWSRPLPDMEVHAIATAGAGEGLLLGTDQGLVRFDGKQSFFWIINLGEEVMLHPKVTSIAWDGSHNLWVGTAGDGLLRYNGDHWERFNTATGLPTDTVRKIFTDSLGTVWIILTTGEGGGALVRYVP